MLCPLCLSNVNGFEKKPAPGGGDWYPCPQCKQGVPKVYLDYYKTHPPVAINLIGYPGHGKTIYQTCLMLAMRNTRGFSHIPADIDSLTQLNRNLSALEHLEVPPSTQLGATKPIILRLTGSAAIPPSQLLIYDGAGEVFAQRKNGTYTYDIQALMQNQPYIRYARNVIWLLSLIDMPSPQDDLMRLLYVYTSAISELGGDSRNQELLVVLTKGDVIEGLPGAPLEIGDFLHANQQGYLKDAASALVPLSDAIGKWLKDDPRYSSFAFVAEDMFAGVRYCAVSALGSAPIQDNQLEFAANPCGVLGPILWMQDFQLPRVRWMVDGKDQFEHSLVRAIEKAPAESTVFLQGEYRIPDGLVISKSLSFVLEDPKQTATIICDAAQAVISIDTAGRFQAKGIAFVHEGAAPAHVAWVKDGTARFDNCTFTGAVAKLDGIRVEGGNAVLFSGSAKGSVTKCLLLGRSVGGPIERGSGICLSDHATATIDGNTCSGNRFGILFEDSAGGLVKGNLCQNNLESGIKICGTATPHLENNRSTLNGSYGLEVLNGSNPTYKGSNNDFTGNKVKGVLDQRLTGMLSAGFEQFIKKLMTWIDDLLKNRSKK